jgi:hypothetical protein
MANIKVFVDGQTDGQTKNYMPPMGIKLYWLFNKLFFFNIERVLFSFSEYKYPERIYVYVITAEVISAIWEAYSTFIMLTQQRHFTCIKNMNSRGTTGNFY